MISAVMACSLLSTGTAAQTLLASEGLGAPSEPLDARSRALGGSGIGLSGAYLLEEDPAASAGLFVPTASFTIQTGTTTLDGGGAAGNTRFPAIAASYPYRGNVFSVRVGSFLDQEWEARSESTIEVGVKQVRVTDRFTSGGSVARVSVGWARSVAESMAVGLILGSHTGTTERVFSRLLNSEDIGAGVIAFEAGGRFRASGAFAGIGAAWDPLPLLHVAGSVVWSDDLVLSPADADASETGRYNLPLELRGGGTVTLASGLGLHLGLTYSDWSDTGLASGVPRGSTWSYGGGLEWLGETLAGRPLPLRVGARHRDLPFLSSGEEASERSLSGGLAFDLVEMEGLPLARLELGVEKGSRQAASFSEQFWRTTVSVRVSAG